MKTNLEMELYQAAATTFEELVFMFVAPEYQEEEEGTGSQGAVAKVNFHGPKEGSLIIKAYGSLVESIAANMLGEDSIQQQHQFDALGEIANVVCGNILPSVDDPKSVFNIDSPVVVDLAEYEEELSDDRKVETKIVLDQGIADLLLILKS